tara:strand:- start:57 stop:2333 length:2277 start_codon:yes stop_codon:yes gene_type:complete
MIEETILKSNFVGRDGFKWWIGQIGPESCQGDQINETGNAWGNRMRVRIMGYHPQNPIELPDKELPWAQVLIPTTAGTGGGGMSRSIRLTPGDSVFGFFLDGDDAQLPVILGAFGRPSFDEPLGPYKQPFQPYTGFTSENPPSSFFINSEVGGQEGAQVISLPVDLPDKLCKVLNEKKLKSFVGEFGEKIGKLKFNKEKLKSSCMALGSILDIPPGDLSNAKTAMRLMKTETENLMGDIKKIKEQFNPSAFKEEMSGLFDLDEVQEVAGELESAANELKTVFKPFMESKVSELEGKMKELVDIRKDDAVKHLKVLGGGIAQAAMSNLTDEVAKKANGGLKKTFDTTFAVVFAATKSRPKAKVAGIRAQEAFLPALKSFKSGLPCVLQNVTDGLGDSISGLLDQFLDNVDNVTDCIQTQLLAGVTNQILGGITKGIMPSLGGISELLGGFSPGDFLRSKAQNLSEIAAIFECADPTPLSPLDVEQLVVGGGPRQVVDSLIDDVMSVANKADGLTKGLVDLGQGLSIAGGGLGVFDFLNPSVSVPGFKSPLGECYTGPKLSCSGVKVNIFGRGGIGATARAIFGNKIGTGVEAVGSIIGIDLTSGGSGYIGNPFVEIVDDCDKGYGAVAQAVIDQDKNSPTYQQVVDVIMISIGENYPIKDDGKPVVVDHIVVINPGTGYDKDDVIEDSSGNEYKPLVDATGRIVTVIPPDNTKNNVSEINDFPELTIRTETGEGAVLRAQLKPRPDYQGEIKQVIDCVS